MRGAYERASPRGEAAREKDDAVPRSQARRPPSLEDSLVPSQGRTEEMGGIEEPNGARLQASTRSVLPSASIRDSQTTTTARTARRDPTKDGPPFKGDKRGAQRRV